MPRGLVVHISALSMELLLEVGGCRREVQLEDDCNVYSTLEKEFQKLEPKVSLLQAHSEKAEPESGAYVLQRFSSKWGVFVDVTDPSQVTSGDKLSVMHKEKLPEKVINMGEGGGRIQEQVTCWSHVT